MVRIVRFSAPPNVKKSDSYKIIRQTKRHYREDATRSIKAAELELKSASEHPVLKSIFWRFEECTRDKGFDDSIGYACGRHLESAACSKCRVMALNRIIEVVSNRNYFNGEKRWMTLIDPEGFRPLGRLSEYSQKDFRDRINQVANQVSQTFQAIGFLEFQTKVDPFRNKGGSFWSPHFHLIVTGEGASDFEGLLRKEFHSPELRGDVLQVKTINDRKGLYRTACYALKSIFSKMQFETLDLAYWKDAPLSPPLELADYLVDFDLSEILWKKGVNFSANHRIEISAYSTLKAWHEENGFIQEFMDNFVVRKILRQRRKKRYWKRG